MTWWDTKAHKRRKTCVNWFCFAAKSTSVSFISSDVCNSPSGLLLQTLMSSRTYGGRRCRRWPVWGYWCSRAHRRCNMRGGGICTRHHGTSCLGSTHLLYLRKRHFAEWCFGKANNVAAFHCVYMEYLQQQFPTFLLSHTPTSHSNPGIVLTGSSVQYHLERWKLDVLTIYPLAISTYLLASLKYTRSHLTPICNLVKLRQHLLTCSF